MKATIRRLGPWLAGAGALAAAGAVSSCKLPSRETVANIRHESMVGLFTDHHGRRGHVNLPESIIPEVEDRRVSSPGVTRPREVPTVITKRMGAPDAAAVPGKAGYVYTPHVSGEWMVDVRQFDTGERVLCPYTRKPFVVPSPATGEGETKVAPPPSVVVQKKPVTAPAEKPGKKAAGSGVASGPSTKPLPRLKKDLPASKPEKEEKGAKKMVEGTPKKADPARTAEASKPPMKKPDKPTAKPSTDDTLPYGERIPGKPNFVFSPFAAKNQYVDVSGLKPGTRVRCPYSGKLFRVPLEAKAEGTGKKPEGKEGKAPPSTKGSSTPEKPADTGKPDGSGTPTAPWLKNKPGYVKSPYGEFVVDVRGKKPGSIVLCPFTGKPFRVPSK